MEWYEWYTNLLKRGCRIALRAKVNDSIITGLTVIDSILPVGRGLWDYRLLYLVLCFKPLSCLIIIGVRQA